MMQGFVTSDGTAYAEGLRENGKSGKFVLDHRGEFTPAESINFGMMFQGVARSLPFENLTETEVRKRAAAAANEQKILVFLPALQDGTVSRQLRSETAMFINSILEDPEMFANVLERFRSAHQRSGQPGPLIDRELTNYDESLAIAQRAGTAHVVNLLTTLRTENIL